MRRMRSNKGFSLVEVMVAMGLFSIVATAGMMLFVSGDSAWSVTSSKIQMQENIRQILLRLSQELQESGDDENGILKVSILDNTGVDNSDILRFSVPVCPCGINIIDQNGEVASWGAPPVWGQSGCSSNYSNYLTGNGKVQICHLPPGNPTNSQSLQVSENAVRAHLAHGDWLGECDDCDPSVYSNKKVEYLLDNDHQLLRRVLDSANNVINSVVFARHMQDFQVSLDALGKTVTLSAQFSVMTTKRRILQKSVSIDVLLRN